MIGGMIPKPASPASSEKMPSHKTTTPADRKKSGAYCDFENVSAPNESKARTGNVPRAKESIISHHITNEPVESAAICMD